MQQHSPSLFHLHSVENIGDRPVTVSVDGGGRQGTPQGWPGGRSTDAAIAMTALGYKNCYNVEGGFEGEPDAGETEQSQLALPV